MPIRRYTVLFLSIVCTLNLCGQLSGTYTVGGTSPNFPSLDSAFNYMELKGVSGKVRLHVRSGNYTLRTTVSTISGVDSNNNIQISPDPSNTSQVIFKNTNDSAKNYLINIKQSYLQFDSLTFIVDSNSTYGTIINFKDTCNTICFNACNFFGKDTNKASINFALLYHDSFARVDNLKLSNCTFLNGSYGLFFNAFSTDYDKKNKIIGCSFQKYYYMAMSLSYQDSLLLEGNYSKDINKYTDAYGYYLSKCYHSTLNSNRIYVSGQGGYGINFTDCRWGTKLYNNIICGYDTTKSGNFTAVYINQLNYYSIYYNTIATFNKSKNSVAIKFNSNEFTSSCILKNNIYYAEKGYALYHDTTDYGYWFTYDIKKSDYNLFYTNRQYFVNRSTAGQYNSLSSYIAGTKLDSHSIYKKIVFENPENLNSLSLDLYKKGTPVKDIKYDIIGRLRKTDKPDIGPYELKLPTIDLALTSVETSTCSDNKDVYVKIKNNGILTIDSSKFMWQISENGSAFVNQINFTFKGKLQTEKDTIIKIGTYNFKPGSYTKVKVWVSTSNNKKDSLATNDTLVTKPILFTMAGDITIGGSSPYFPTIDSALRTAKRVGLCGPVRFLLRSGNYNEKLIFDSIRGVSSINTISFISDPKNTKTPQVSYKASGPNDNNVILLKNISYVTISGISFYSLDTNYNRIVEIQKNVRYLNLTNDSFISKVMYIKSTDSVNKTPFIPKNFANKTTIYCNASSNSMLTVQKCILKNNFVGIGFTNCPKSSIINNTILNTTIAAIFFDNSDSIHIESNKIESNVSNSIKNNNSGLLGIYLRSNNCKIQKNKIILNSYGQRQWGITVNATKKCHIANNSVSIINNDNSATSFCLNVDRPIDTTFVYNNSLYMYSGSSGANPNIFVQYDGIKMNDIFSNNNIMNDGGGSAMYFNTLIDLKVTTRNNNIYSNGSNIISHYLFNKPIINYAKLSDWRNKFPSDSHSLSERLTVTNPTDLNLKSMKLKWKGVPNNFIKTDINGNKIDSLKPDIGAYVIIPAKIDLELIKILSNSLPILCGMDSSYISTVIFNNGGDTLSNFNIYSNIKNTNNQNYNLTYTYTKKLNPGAYDTVKLNKFNTSKGGYFNIKTYIDSSLVSNRTNDTLYTNSALLYDSPVPPKSKNDTLCDNNVYAITPTFPTNSFLKWYSSEKGNELIAINDTLRINHLKHDTSFFISSVYQHDVPSSLKTAKTRDTKADGGIMFNLKPKKDIFIDSFSSIFINSGANKNVNVFLKKGTFSGFETKYTKWVLTDSAIASPLDDSLEYTIRLRKPIKLLKDSLYAFYLNFDARVTTGTLSTNNNDLTFYNGVGLSYYFGGVNVNNIFNGQIYYNAPFYCESARVKYSIKIKNTRKLNIGKDTAYCANSAIYYPLNSNLINAKYRWSTGDTTKSIFAKNSGMFSLTLIDSNQCELIDTVIITKYLSPTLNLGPDVNYCASNGINLQLNAGSNFVSYLWSTGIKTKNITVKSPGIYSVTVTNNLGCKGGDTISVNKITDPIVNLGKDTSYCSLEGILINLDAGNNYKVYKWSNMDSIRKITITKKGKYYLDVTDDFNCKGSDTIIVTEKTSPVVKLNNDTFYCRFDNFSLLLDAGAGLKNYLWSNNANSQKILVKTNGTYSVIATAFNDCIGKDTIVISERHLEVNIGKDTSFCENDGIDIVLDAGPGYKKYQWMDGMNTQSIRAKKEGEYHINVEGYNGCTAKDTLLILKHTNPLIKLGPDLVLNPDIPLNETLDAGVGHQRYQWNTNETTQSIIAKKTGTYSVMVTDSNGCSGFDTIQIRQWNKTNLKNEKLELVKIFPNPTSQNITISSYNNVLENIHITNSIGQEIYTCNARKQITTINTEDWANGIYTISYVINDRKFQSRFTVCH